MQQRIVSTITTYGVLALAGGIALVLPPDLAIQSAEAAPPEYRLVGTVYDFLSTHPDFNVVPAEGFGHYAANVGTALGPDQRPVFAPGGFKLASEWTDSGGRPIAPHMFNVNGKAAPSLAANGSVQTGGGGIIIDGYDSSAGPYGGPNSGLDVTLSTNATGSNVMDLADTTLTGDLLAGPGADTAIAIKLDSCVITGVVDTLTAAVPMPIITAPGGLGPSVGNVDYVGGTWTLSADVHCDKFNIDDGALVQVSGDVTVLTDSEFKIANDSDLEILPGSSLTVYAGNNVKVYGSRMNVNTGDPSLVRIFVLGPGNATIELDTGSELHAYTQSPAGELYVSDGRFFGTYVGDKMKFEDGAEVHVDLGAVGATCGPVNDLPGAAGAASDAAITSAASFDEWFRDVLGVTQSAVRPITLTDNGAGVYEYLSSGFYPIDGQLLGNEGTLRNDFFTYTISAAFTYEACMGQFLDFQGGDGTWVFVDDQMVIDLGGVTPFDTQRVDLDRLGLEDGEVFTIRLFYAHRNAFSAVFRLRTNLELETTGMPSITAVFD